MNLLESQWIPVRSGMRFRQISLEELLCSHEPFQLSLPRDDMEMAALQLLICLVQVTLMPKDREALRQRLEQPLDNSAYRDALGEYQEWFILDHPEHPFMQTRGVKSKDSTPIQKLFVGLPEGNNHAFFNDKGEITAVCPACSVVALFNQASNCPSFGGGFKSNLRGSAPINTFASGDSLRETLWLNVLTQDSTEQILTNLEADNRPVWVEPIRAKAKIPAHTIGLLRGLFWQPARLELLLEKRTAECDFCHTQTDTLVTGFNKEKFVYDIEGLWPHPHSPRIWDIKKDAKERERFLSFTTTAPAWTQLNHCALQFSSNKQGSVPAAVITQFQEVFAARRKLNLLVSGYRNNQASILERRHELFSMPQDWDKNARWVRQGIDYALAVKTELRNKLYGFAKEVGANIFELAERRFYHATEPMIHQLLREMDRREAKQVLSQFKAEVVQLARNLFESLTQPYQHDPEGLKYFALYRRSFESALAKLNR